MSKILTDSLLLAAYHTQSISQASSISSNKSVSQSTFMVSEWKQNEAQPYIRRARVADQASQGN